MNLASRFANLVFYFMLTSLPLTIPLCCSVTLPSPLVANEFTYVISQEHWRAERFVQRCGGSGHPFPGRHPIKN